MWVSLFYLNSLSNLTYNLFIMILQSFMNQRLTHSYHFVCILFFKYFFSKKIFNL
jgi:hypothetical protein